MAGNGGRGVDDLDTGAGDALDERAQERVVGTAEHQDVRPFIEEGLHGGADDFLCFCAVQNAPFDEFHEALADVLHNPDIILELSPGFQVFGPLQRPRRGEVSL